MTYFGEKRDRQRERELLSFEIGCKKERNLLLYIILHVSKCISEHINIRRERVRKSVRERMNVCVREGERIMFTFHFILCFQYC